MLCSAPTASHRALDSRPLKSVTDGHVRIWSTDAILNCSKTDYNKPKQLAAVSNHSGVIHAVRFSSSGRYLASGADDRVVCVYIHDPNPPTHSTFGMECCEEAVDLLLRYSQDQTRNRPWRIGASFAV